MIRYCYRIKRTLIYHKFFHFLIFFFISDKSFRRLKVTKYLLGHETFNRRNITLTNFSPIRYMGFAEYCSPEIGSGPKFCPGFRVVRPWGTKISRSYHPFSPSSGIYDQSSTLCQIRDCKLEMCWMLTFFCRISHFWFERAEPLSSYRLPLTILGIRARVKNFACELGVTYPQLRNLFIYLSMDYTIM